MRIELTLYGPIPSKKNQYRAIVRTTGKHKGKAALVKDRKLSSKLNYLVEQIDPEAWDLKLTHPRITFRRACPAENMNQDRDGMLTTLLDLLVRLGIIADDSDLFNNGRWVIEPTIVSSELRVDLTLETDDD